METINDFIETLKIEFPAFKKQGRSVNYKARKNLYQPGTIVAIPLLEHSMNSELVSGRYGVAVVRGCNWNGNLHLFLFPYSFDHIPEQLEVIVDPDDLWFIASTGDMAIVTGHWPVVGHIEPWEEDQWPEVIWHPYPFKGTATRESFEPRRRMKEETFETTVKELPPKMWKPLVATAAGVVSDLSVSHEFPDAPWPKPMNTGEFPAAMTAWMKKWR